MTIRKNENFGQSISRPTHLIALRDDREIAQRYMQSQVSGGSGDDVTDSFFTVTRGSIAQALGIDCRRAKSADARSATMTQVSLDLIKIEYRTSQNLTHEVIGAGSLLLNRRSFCNVFLIVSNSGIIKGRDVFPRAHPNDGVIDVLVVDEEISLRQRLLAWHKSKIGVHLPHPQLHVSRQTQFEWSGQPARMVVDGATFHKVEWMRCSIVKDAFAICF